MKIQEIETAIKKLKNWLNKNCGEQCEKENIGRLKNGTIEIY